MSKKVESIKPTTATSKVSEAKKVVTKKAVVKKSTTKKVAVEKTAVKKPTAKKVAVKKTVAKKSPVEKVVNKKIVEKPYETKSLEECLELTYTLGVNYEVKDYMNHLLEQSDYSGICKKIAKIFKLKEKQDLELINAILEKVEVVMDIKAKDYLTIKKEMEAFEKVKFGKSDLKNAKVYLGAFTTCEKLLMIGQRKDVHSASEVSMLVGSDVEKFVDHFFKFAYTILPTWQYNDLKFYEDFACTLLSQYDDLFDSFQLRILIDCADLYIKFHDYQRGDSNYGYILRENQIKDYIYYRYAKAYEDIDMNKAKHVAYQALEIIDERYVYFDKIKEIIEK